MHFSLFTMHDIEIPKEHITYISYSGFVSDEHDKDYDSLEIRGNF